MHFNYLQSSIQFLLQRIKDEYIAQANDDESKALEMDGKAINNTNNTTQPVVNTMLRLNMKHK